MCGEGGESWLHIPIFFTTFDWPQGVVNPFFGVAREQLEAWLLEAQRQYAERTTPQSIGAGDFSSTDFVEGNPLERIEALYKALNVIAPEEYPLDQIRRRNRTRMTVSNSELFDG